MSTRDDIAVVILNYNGSKVLPEYLPSVLSYSDEAEVIVVDNASTDDSLHILTKYNCKVIEFSENHGFAGGYNKALSHPEINHKYILLLNSDVRVTKNWLPPLITAIKSDDTLASVMPAVRADRNPSHYEYAGAAGGFWDRLGYPYCRGRIFSDVEAVTSEYNDAIPIYWSSGAAMLVRREHFIKTGGFDESYFAHQEEIDWCWRVINQGYYHKVVPSSEVYHLGGGTLDYTHPRKTFLNFRNNIFTLIKNKRSSLTITLLMRFVLDMIASLSMITRPAQVLAVWKAWLAIIVNYGTYHRKRKQLITRRKDIHPIYKESKHNKMSILFNYYLKSNKKFNQL